MAIPTVTDRNVQYPNRIQLTEVTTDVYDVTAVPGSIIAAGTAVNKALLDRYAVETQTTGASAKTTPVDADLVPIVDSAASNVLKKLTWANIKATLTSYFDPLYGSMYSVTTSGGDKVGQYTKLATITIVGQYNGVDQEIALVSNTGGTRARYAKIKLRVMQQVAMASAPYIDLVVNEYKGHRPVDFVTVTTQNDANATVVSLYWCPNATYEYPTFRPLIYKNKGTASSEYFSDQAFSASLPAGTQTVGHDGKSHVSASRSTTLNVATGTTPTTMIYATEALDTLGEYNPSTGIFTALEPGWYRVDATAALTSAAWAANNYFAMYVLANSSTSQRVTSYAMAAATFIFTNQIHDEVWLEAGDTLSIALEHNQGSTLTAIASAHLNTLKINRVS